MKMRCYVQKIVVLFLLMLIGVFSYAQTKTIKGTVKGEDATALPGVTVVVKETAQGTISNMDGEFVLPGVPENATIKFSFIGMKSKEIPVTGISVIDVVLESESIGLEEVVAVGYGSQRKSDLTGAISSIDSKAFELQPVTTMEEGLQGKLSGVQVIQSTGQPGAGSSMRIRGIASLSGSTEPLYVVDGVPQFNPDVREANGLSNLDPNEIASIEVLKDAASTAIYGSRAANGVVMITTKMGRSGIPTLKYSTNVGIQQVRNKLDMMSGPEYYDFTMSYFDNSIADGDQTTADKDQAIQQFNSIGIANVDWQDELFKTAVKQNHNISISGGTDMSKYFVSASYTDHKGIIKGTDFERVALRANLDNKINDRLNLTTRLTVSRTLQNRFVGTDGTNDTADGKTGIGAMFMMEPSIPGTDADGNITDAQPYGFSGVNNVNPLAYLDAVDQRKAYRFQGIVDVNVKIIEGLTNTTRLGGTYDRSKMDEFLPSSVLINAQQVKLYTNDNLNLLAENFLTYQKQVNDDFGFNFVAGLSFQQDQTELLQINGKGLPDDVLQNNALQALTSMAPPESYYIDKTLQSVFLRGNFNIKNRYLLNASVRRDGASQFAKGNKYATFPGASLAWRISNEEFLSDNATVSDMKLRASWGQTGNQAIQPYQSLTIGNTVNTPAGSGTGLNTGLAPNLPNTDLTWETTAQTNIGFDLGLMNQKYRFSLDLYNKNTTDLLAYVLLPPSAGFTSIIDNLGEIRNRGIEFSAAVYIPVNNDLNFTMDANFSKNENEVIKTNNGIPIISSAGDSNDNSWSTTIVKEGESLSSFFLIKYLGDDADGNPIHEDINGDGEITDADRQIVGKSLPDFIYGLNISADYKRLSLYMNFTGAAGLSVHNVMLGAMVSPSPGINKRTDLTDYYSRPSFEAANLHRGSSRFLEDASYFRLKNIKLNYSLPIKSNNIISKVDLYASAQNLFTFTKYSGYDPEVNSFSGADLRQGIDNRAYPSVKTFTVGLNVTF